MSDNVIYFATSGLGPPELWVSNGTPGGTYVVQSFPSESTVYPLFEYAGVFITLSTGFDETDFYATEGSAQTTIDAIGGLPVGPLLLSSTGGGSIFAVVPPITVGNPPLIIDGADGYLLENDFTSTNSQIIDQFTNPSSGEPDPLADFVAVGTSVYFVVDTSATTASLDVTQGVPGAVQTVLTAGTFSALAEVTDPTLGARLLLAATTGNDTKLEAVAPGSTTPTVIDNLGNASVGTIVAAASTVFITETTASGSALLAGGTGNAAPTAIASFTGAAPTEVTAAADGSARVFFVQGGSLWVATATGATELATQFTGIGALFALGSVVYFAAATTGTGNQLWSWDGSAAGPTQLSSANAAGGGINPTDFAALNGVLYFSANDGAGGTELWTSDGTAQGTAVAVNLDPGGATGTISGITPGVAEPPPPVLTSVVEYVGYLDSSGVTDGTQDGTLPTTAGVISITGATEPDFQPALAISHGEGVQIEVPVGAIAGGYVSVAPGSGGDFYAVDDYDAQDVTSGPVTLGYIATTSITPVALATFNPAAVGDAVAISQTVSGNTDYFVVSQSSQNGTPIDSQLFVSNGTTVQEIGDLGAVSGGYLAAADGAFWAALVDDARYNGELAFSAGGGAPTVVTNADLGLVNDELDNAYTIAVLGTLVFIGTYPEYSNTVELLVTNGTAAGTQVLLSDSGTYDRYGGFTNFGTLLLFTDPSGNLYATNGTAAGTTELLAGDALLAPAVEGESTNTTATITYDGVTYLYFTATVNGETGLYRTDGRTVQTIQAAGVSTEPSIVALDGNILYTATATGAAGATFTTIFATNPATTTGAPIVDTADYVANSYLDPLQAPTASTLTPATLAAIGQTFTLTTGTDVIQGGTADNTILAETDTLNPTDTIDAGAGGLNVLYLQGDGTFDLSAPASLTGLSAVVAQGPDQDIILRPGTSLDVYLESTSGLVGGTVQGADNADVIIGESDAFYYVTVGGPDETVDDVGRVIEPTADSAASVEDVGVLELTGGGVATLGPQDDFIDEVELDAPTQLTVDLPSGDGEPTTEIIGSSGPDTITVEQGIYVFDGKAPGDTLTLTGTGAAELLGTAANLNGDTINGYDFVASTGTTALIDISNLLYTSAETVQPSGNVLTVTNGTITTTITITGLAAALAADPQGAFLASSDGGGGSLLTYQQQVFRLTTGIDTVDGTANNTIIATNNTLNKGDVINGGAYTAGVSSSVLLLQGAGTFDLGAPTTLTGITTVEGDPTTGAAAIAQTIILRAGTLDSGTLFNTIALGAGADTVIGVPGDKTEITNAYGLARSAGYTITLGDAAETVNLQAGNAADSFITDPATALASITDDGFDYLPEGTETVAGSGIVGVGQDNVGTLALAAGQDAFLLGGTPEQVIGGGGDVIDASFSAAGDSGGSVTINPGGAGTVIASMEEDVVLAGSAAQLNGATFDGFNFGPPAGFSEIEDSILISNFTNAASLQATLTGDMLTVTDGLAQSVTITLPGAPAGSFTPLTASDGTTLTFNATSPITPVSATFNGTGFTGTVGDDSLTVTAGQLAAGQTIDGGGGINTLTLSGTGSFDLSQPATLANFQYLDVAAGQTVTLRPSLVAEIDGTDATILGAANADPIVLGGYEGGGNTVVLGSGQATVIDGTGYGVNTIVADPSTLGATIYGGHTGADVLEIDGGGPAVMGSNIYDIGTIGLGLTGLDLQVNNNPGLTITVSGSTGTPGTVQLGAGGDTIIDTSSGGNTFVSNPADAVFAFGSSYGNEPSGDTIENFDQSGNDSILIENVDYSSFSYSDNVLTISNGAGTASTYYKSFIINLPGSYDADDFVGKYLEQFGQAEGFQITYTGPVTCFRAGTRILTDRGEVPVEALAVGHVVQTVLSGPQPIRWIGRRQIDLARHPSPRLARPVRIAAGTFGPALPRRDLWLSPDHAVLIDGMLIPVRRLLNGASIAQIAVPDVSYFHIELARHDILLAEGLPSESYLDTGNRDTFETASGPIALYPDLLAGRPTGGSAPCRPFATDATEVERIWQRLAGTSEAAARQQILAATTRDPQLRLAVAGRDLLPIVASDRRHVFALPPGTHRAWLVSRAADPSSVRPWLDDRRSLGVAVAGMLLHDDMQQAALPLDDPRLEDGWHGVERDHGQVWRWTGGRASLALPPATRLLDVRIRAVTDYPLASRQEYAGINTRRIVSRG